MPAMVLAQTQKDIAFDAFENLMGGVWMAEDEWMNGDEFKQKIVYVWSDDKEKILVKTYNYVDDSFVLSTNGARIWDDTAGKMIFMDKTVDGEETAGDVSVFSNGFHYEYPYETDNGSKIMRDTWMRITDEVYALTVGIWGEGKYEKVFLNTTFKKTTN